jgi:YVTN family beta-propeller protein
MRYYADRLLAKRIADNIRKAAALAALVIVALCASSCGRGSAPGVESSADLGDYKSPWGMVVNADETRLYVANYLLNTVDVVDIATMRVSNSIPVMCDPRRLAFNSNRTKLFVTHDNQLETRHCSTSKYLPSQIRRNGAWLTVIDVAQLKVVNEISLKIEGSEPSHPSDIVYDPVYDVMYVTARSNFFITAVDPETETALSHVSFFSGKKPYRIRLDAARGIGYAVDNANNRIYPFAMQDPRTETFSKYYYDGQTTGICGGTKGNKNFCPCTANSNCNSKLCSTIPILPYCDERCVSESWCPTEYPPLGTDCHLKTVKSCSDLTTNATCASYGCLWDNDNNKCNSANGSNVCNASNNKCTWITSSSSCVDNNKSHCDLHVDCTWKTNSCVTDPQTTGCVCSRNSSCDTNLCSSGICVTESSFGVNDIRAFCDRSTGQCKTASEMGITNTCENPWDVLPAPDQTLYVTCGGSTSKASQSQPVLKIYADADGFASSNTAVAAQSSFQYCVKPTELAADPDWEYVFVLCSGSNKLLYLDAASGEPLGYFSVPDGAYGLTVSNRYAFVSSSSQNEILKISIP